MLKRIREWRPFNRHEPIVTDEEHWHSAEQLYSDASAWLARHKYPVTTDAEEHMVNNIREAVRTHRAIVLAPDSEPIVRPLNPYEIAAVRFTWRQQYGGPEKAHVAVEGL